MARGKYYIVKDGERLYRDSVSAIAKLAQRFADEIGGSVTVFEDHTGMGFGGRRKGIVKPYKRNPAPKKYSGKYPNRIESIGGIAKAYQDELGGKYQARTNSGKLYTIFPVNGLLPKLGSDISDWPKKKFTGQSTKRR